MILLLQIFAEDFEAFDKAKWDDFGRAPEAIEIVEGGPRGKGLCAQITATPGENTGAHLYKMLDPGLETAYLRFYVKFEAEHDYVHHFVHLTGYNPATKWPQGGAGERPDGDKRFSTGIEPWGDWGRHEPPGAWRFYTYWCEMKESRDGKFWGNGFGPEEPALVARDRWTCVEVMLRCNDPEQADGAQAFWIDGEKQGEWDGIRWRTDAALKVNGVWVLYYITEQATKRPVSRVWFDEIVVSEAYIGPIEE